MALINFAGSPHGGIQKLLPEWQSQPQIRPVGLVKHTIVGSAAGAFAYFRDLTGVESTFILPKTGQIWQVMDTGRTADAQVSGNSWTVGGVRYGFLSVETEDNGDPAHDPWTTAQVESLIWLDDKLAKVHGFPRKQTAAPSGANAGGTGYHSMWGINTRTAKPNPWTTADGKTCPAAPRIAQYKTKLLPAYIAGSTPTLKEFLMALTDPEQEEVLRGARSAAHLDLMLSQNNTVGDINAIATNEALQGTAIAALAKGQVAQSAQLAEILARLPAPSPGA